MQRPELRAGGNGRFGRRDFVWLTGGEAFLSYHKRNVLGFSLDFAEDVAKTNWSFEFTWFDDDLFGSNTSRSLMQEGDAYNLTISVDRPTFVNFLNANRTFFMNAQLFLGYLPALQPELRRRTGRSTRSSRSRSRPATSRTACCPRSRSSTTSSRRRAASSRR